MPAINNGRIYIHEFMIQDLFVVTKIVKNIWGHISCLNYHFTIIYNPFYALLKKIESVT